MERSYRLVNLLITWCISLKITFRRRIFPFIIWLMRTLTNRKSFKCESFCFSHSLLFLLAPGGAFSAPFSDSPRRRKDIPFSTFTSASQRSNYDYTYIFSFKSQTNLALRNRMEANTELLNKMKSGFYASLFSKDSNYNSVLMTKRKYDSVLEDVKRIKLSKKKESSRDYRIIKRYDVVTVDGREKLVEPMSGGREGAKMFVHAEELFDILCSTHLSIGHGGRDKMVKQLNALYRNITQAQVKLFLDLCEPCQQKQKSERRGTVEKQVVPSHFSSRCQVNLIDYQSRADGQFKFLLVYQDHLTKFVVLKPLTSDTADEVAYNLLDVFLLLGAPSILHSDKGREFCSQVLEHLKEMWPELKMVHGKPERSHNQESAEGNQEIENMLANWMAGSQTDSWSEGLRFIQFSKNRAYHSDIKKSPYEAMFGCPAKVGLSSSVIPRSVLHSVNAEEDLEKLVDSQEIVISESQSNLAQDDIILTSVSAESSVNRQECADGNLIVPATPLSPFIEDTLVKNVQLPCTSKESYLLVEKIKKE